MEGMTWIHANALRQEQRTLRLIGQADMQIDISPAAKLIDNTWSMTIPEDVWSENPIREGHYVYAPGTEWGGPVTLIRHVTREGKVTLQGPTWRGLLHQRRICPPEGLAYLEISEEANATIADVLGEDFGGLFVVSTADTGVTVTAQFRYQSVAGGLQNALRSAGMRLDVKYDYTAGGVLLSAQPISDLASTVEISQDYGVNFTSAIGNVELANHCLALGSGELTERMVINLYRVGMLYYTERPEEIPESAVRTVLLDYPNAETAGDLIKTAAERLRDCGPQQSLDVDELLLDIDAQLGDQIPVRDRLTGLQATSEILSKILTISGGGTSITAKVGVLTIAAAE